MTGSCTYALLSRWMSRFSDPEQITSDRGTTFTFQLWTSLANLLGIIIHQTTTYNHAANGMVERFHRTLKNTLMCLCKDSNWIIQLPWVLLGLKTTPKNALYFLPAEIVYDDLLVVPAEHFPSTPSPYNL
ncbi:uncharacterized protein [Palaemon carinicauda]|uniref:uncharacterized protein n=1 Tax=Palaemon carinicauda TaxID=392227 RepID=UPI0035B60A1A